MGGREEGEDLVGHVGDVVVHAATCPSCRVRKTSETERKLIFLWRILWLRGEARQVLVEWC